MGWLRLEGTSRNCPIPKPCLEQGQLQQVSQGFVQSVSPTLETSKISWKICSRSWLPYSKRCFLVFKLNFHYFSFRPSLLVQSLSPLSRVWLFLIPHSWVFVHMDTILLSLHLCGISNPRFLSLFSHVKALYHLCWTHSSSSIFFLFLGIPEWDSSLQEHLPGLLAAFMPQAFHLLFCKGTLLACGQPVLSLQNCFSGGSQSLLVPGVVPPQAQDSAPFFAEFQKIPVIPFLQLLLHWNKIATLLVLYHLQESEYWSKN